MSFEMDPILPSLFLRKVKKKCFFFVLFFSRQSNWSAGSAAHTQLNTQTHTHVSIFNGNSDFSANTNKMYPQKQIATLEE